MLITKEQQEALVDKYVREQHNTDECVGFVDGINAAIELFKILSMPNCFDKKTAKVKYE